jgi:simple sugar transport system ATP-binding protein
MSSFPATGADSAPVAGLPLAEAVAVSKQFGETLANDRVDFDVRGGEVHALVGENGAGKSTLCSILAGLYRPDSGELLIDGATARFDSPSDALRAGVGMVYQHFRLVSSFTVAENLFLGNPSAPRWLRRRELEARTAQLMERYGLEVAPGARVRNLTVGERQRVEILRLLAREVRVLILDEPTAVLAPSEAQLLLAALRRLAAQGRAVVLVSHKLAEVTAVADRFTVMRDGKRVLSAPAGVTADELARAMFDRPRDVVRPSGDRSGEDRPPAATGPAPLELSRLCVRGDDGSERVADVTLTVGHGEIVGIAGVAGNGQRELAEALAGLRRPTSGTIVLDGVDMTSASVRARADRGLAYVPEDRLHVGVAGALSVERNVVLRSYWRPPAANGPFVSRRAERELAAELVARFDVKGVREGVPVRALSGGNVQRLILGRELSQAPRLLVAASPTRGLDAAASERIRSLLLDARARGAGVLLLSEDLDELFAVSDTIVVMYSGRVVAALPREQATLDSVGALMTGLGAGRE